MSCPGRSQDQKLVNDVIDKGLFDAEPRTPATTTPTTMQRWIAYVFMPALAHVTAAR